MGEAFLVFLTITGGIIFVIGVVGGAITGWKADREGKTTLQRFTDTAGTTLMTINGVPSGTGRTTRILKTKGNQP